MRRFVDKHKFEDRCEVSKGILAQHPTMIPIICEPSARCNLDLTHYTKVKYLVPREITIGRFLLIIRTQMQLKPETAMFLFVNDTLPPTSSLVNDIYEHHKNADGFLYMEFVGENTFG